MALSISQLSELGKDLTSSLDKIKSSQSNIKQIQKDKEDLNKKQNLIKTTFYDKFHNIVTAYQNERRWLDGTTYADVPYSQIDDAAQKKNTNVHYTGTWSKYSPLLTSNINGNPTSSSVNSEDASLNDSLDNNGILALINLLVNGQSSGVANDILTANYSPGSPTIDVNNGGQTNGSLLILSGSGTSALVRITNVAGLTLSITEIIPPVGTITTGGFVRQNIPGFSNSERNTLSSGLYQNVLNQLTSKINTEVGLWETAVLNQKSELTLNQDVNPNIATAITSATNALTDIDTWQALPNTGTLGTDSKYTDNNLLILTTKASTRNSFKTTRVSQITSALGEATQDSDGIISGTGFYSQRFKSISLLINLIDGPLSSFYGKDIVMAAAQQAQQNELGKQDIYSSRIKFTKLKQNATGTNIINVVNSTGFAVSNTILVIADNLPDIQATISGISGTQITLSTQIPADYVVGVKAAIVKEV